ncbi:hypothetical protein ACVII0_004388 [Sinorhizobium meliloti]|nr:hypothetical protein CN215_35610 [Sinorhizobium meliloti]
MADAQKNELILDCQRGISKYLPSESGISEHQLLQMLISRLDGCLGEGSTERRWQGWWPDDDGDGGGSPGFRSHRRVGVVRESAFAD